MLRELADARLAEAPLLASTGVGAVSAYAEHLRKITSAFNGHAERLGLGVRLDPEPLIVAARWAPSPVVLQAFAPGVLDGVVQSGHLRTVLDCIANMLADPNRAGLVLGPLQSNKHLTAMALQFAGPIVYLLTGRVTCPIHLITRDTRSADGVRRDLARFMDLFGELRITMAPGRAVPAAAPAGFAAAPSIASYRKFVLDGRLPDLFIGQDEYPRRARAGAPSFGRAAQLAEQAAALGWTALFIVDEPEFKVVEAGVGPARRPEFLEQIVDAVRASAQEGRAAFVGLSSTPYGEVDARYWVVKRYLSTPYVGFNALSDAVIEEGVGVYPPRLLTFAQLGEAYGERFFRSVDLSAYAAPAAAFARFARKRRLDNDQAAYRVRVEAALRAVIHAIAQERRADAAGLCIRFFKNHKRSQELLARLDLDPEKIEVVQWDDSGAPERRLRRAIEGRKRKDTPFLVLLSDEARMTGGFPRVIEWFLDFSRAATIEELLRGPLGGACGCNRRASAAVLPDASMRIVAEYMTGQRRAPGARQASQHRPGAPTSLLRLYAETKDPVVQAFFERIEREVVEPEIGAHAGAFRITGGHRRRMGPILRIAEEVGLFAHLETPEVRQRLFPTMTEGMRIARAEDAAVRPRARAPLRYLLDGEGNCRFSFQRAWGGRNAHGAGRAGYGDQSVIERTRDRHHLEPQIHVLKVDPDTWEAINDAHLDEEAKRPGRWMATMIVLPLQHPVRELRLA